MADLRFDWKASSATWVLFASPGFAGALPFAFVSKSSTSRAPFIPSTIMSSHAFLNTASRRLSSSDASALSPLSPLGCTDSAAISRMRPAMPAASSRAKSSPTESSSIMDFLVAVFGGTCGRDADGPGVPGADGVLVFGSLRFSPANPPSTSMTPSEHNTNAGHSKSRSPSRSSASSSALGRALLGLTLDIASGWLQLVLGIAKTGECGKW